MHNDTCTAREREGKKEEKINKWGWETNVISKKRGGLRRLPIVMISLSTKKVL